MTLELDERERNMVTFDRSLSTNRRTDRISKPVEYTIVKDMKELQLPPLRLMTSMDQY